MLYLGNFYKIILFVMILLFVYVKFNKRKRIEESVILFGFCIYLVYLLEIVIFPIMLDFPSPDYTLTINLVPFNTINEMAHYDFSIFLRQIIGNIIILVPFGFFMPMIFKKFMTILPMITLGVLTSIGIECIQGIIDVLTQYDNRTIDIDDIILNVLGTLIGFLIFRLSKIFINKYLPKIVCYNISS